MPVVTSWEVGDVTLRDLCGLLGHVLSSPFVGLSWTLVDLIIGSGTCKGYNKNGISVP